MTDLTDSDEDSDGIWIEINPKKSTVRMAEEVAGALREIHGEMSHLYALAEMTESTREDTKKLWRAVLEELDKHGK